MKVKIKVGFAEGLEGEVVAEFGMGYSVKITYPEGFQHMGTNLGGVTDDLYYMSDELEIL